MPSVLDVRPPFTYPLQATALVPAWYQGLISPSNVVQIYVATLHDMRPAFENARKEGLLYQPAQIKSVMFNAVLY